MFKKFLRRLRSGHKWRHVALALSLGFILTLVSGWLSYSESVQGGVAEQVIRFHVRANSDDESDQDLKTLVKDSVLEHFRHGLEQAADIEQTREFLSENLTSIEDYATALVSDAGYEYPVTAEITNEYFPTRAYGDVKLPAGMYETLRINIGEAEGQNWWCVMFPPLCYVDVSVKEIPEKEKIQLKALLSDEEYALVTGDGKDIEIKFMMVELWQKVKAGSEFYIVRK